MIDYKCRKCGERWTLVVRYWRPPCPSCGSRADDYDVAGVSKPEGDEADAQKPESHTDSAMSRSVARRIKLQKRSE